MQPPRFFTRKKTMPVEDTTQSTEDERLENDESSNVPESTPVEPAGESEQHDDTTTKRDCPNCEGTGLADRKTMGNAAQVLCTDCEGSGKI